MYMAFSCYFSLHPVFSSKHMSTSPSFVQNQHSCFNTSPGKFRNHLSIQQPSCFHMKSDQNSGAIQERQNESKELFISIMNSATSMANKAFLQMKPVFSQCLALTTQTLSASGGLDFSNTTYQVPEEYLKSISVSSGYDLS